MTRARAAAAILALALAGGCGGRSTFLGAKLPSSCRTKLSDARDAGDRCVGWVFDRLAVVARDDEYDDRELRAYVAGIARRIAEANGLAVPTVRVTDRGNAPASAQPGGYLYLTRDLLVALASEAELAAVIGHELAHEAAGHTSDLLDAFPPSIEGDLADERARDDEAIADELAVAYLERAGYSPDAMRTALLALDRASTDAVRREANELVAEVFADMKREGITPGEDLVPEPDVITGAAYLVLPERERILDERHLYPRPVDPDDPTHPAMPERIARVTLAIAGRTDGELGIERYREHIAGVIVGRDPRRGELVDTTWSVARLGLVVELPKTWKFDASEAKLYASAPENEATLWSMGKGWGDAVADTLSQRERRTIAGHRAVIGVAEDPNASSTRRRSELEVAMDAPRPSSGSWVAVITVGERALTIYVNGRDPEAQLAAVLGRVRAMTAAERAAVMPTRLGFVTATADGTAGEVQTAACARADDSRWLEDQNRRVNVGSVVKCVAK